MISAPGCSFRHSQLGRQGDAATKSLGITDPTKQVTYRSVNLNFSQPTDLLPMSHILMRDLLLGLNKGQGRHKIDHIGLFNLKVVPFECGHKIDNKM